MALGDTFPKSYLKKKSRRVSRKKKKQQPYFDKRSASPTLLWCYRRSGVGGGSRCARHVVKNKARQQTCWIICTRSTQVGSIKMWAELAQPSQLKWSLRHLKATTAADKIAHPWDMLTEVESISQNICPAGSSVTMYQSPPQVSITFSPRRQRNTAKCCDKAGKISTLNLATRDLKTCQTVRNAIFTD